MRALRFALAASAALASILGASSARAADPYTGPDIVNVVAQSADVMRVHQYFLRTAMDVDSAPGYVSDGIARYMPASFRASDGSTFKGTLVRITGTSSIGRGHPRTGSSFFGGLSLDLAGVDATSGNYNARHLDGFLFLGGAYQGFMASAGVRALNSWSHIDALHRFVLSSPGSNTVYRPGTPGSLVGQVLPEAPDSWYATPMLNLHHAEGATLGGAFDVVQQQLPDGTYTTERTLSALRGLLEPEPWIRRLGLRKLGVPLAGLDRFAAGVDRWGDRAKQVQDAFNKGLAPPPALTSPQYEIPIGVDDLGGVGVRIKAITQVYPHTFFRGAELAWAYSAGALEGGARAVAFKRADAYTGAGEAFLGISAGNVFRFALSYSYNVPEAETFYPIPNASVIGLQFTLGDARFARPIVPLLACAKANAARVNAIKDSKCADGTGVPALEDAK